VDALTFCIDINGMGLLVSWHEKSWHHLILPLTAAIGEKYRSVLVIIPTFGTSEVMSGFVISRDDDPRMFNGFCIPLSWLLKILWNWSLSWWRRFVDLVGTSDNGRPIQANDKVIDDKANNKISLDFMMTAVQM